MRTSLVLLVLLGLTLVGCAEHDKKIEFAECRYDADAALVRSSVRPISHEERYHLVVWCMRSKGYELDVMKMAPKDDGELFRGAVNSEQYFFKK